MKRLIQKIANLGGYKIIKSGVVEPIIKQDKIFMNFYERCKDYTMTSIESMFQLYQSVKYIIKSNIKGDFVECGVWKGGSIMVIVLTLLYLGIKDRKIILYDTFEGMSKPTKEDVTVNGEEEPVLDNDYLKCYSPLEEVKMNLKKTNYPMENFIFVKGKVEDTIPKNIPDKIALLRLDTDWYESTKHELRFLYPLLQKKGILVIDDYGVWAGSRKATDEYFKNKNILLNRIDYTTRFVVK